MPKPIPAADALSLVLGLARPAAARRLPLSEATGCVLDEEIRADRDGPPFDRAMMDGFAVRLSDAGQTVPVTGEVAAGAAPGEPLSPGRAVRIMTGAPCPEGTETVVPVEEVTWSRRAGSRCRRTSMLRSTLPAGAATAKPAICCWPRGRR